MYPSNTSFSDQSVKPTFYDRLAVPKRHHSYHHHAALPSSVTNNENTTTSSLSADTCNNKTLKTTTENHQIPLTTSSSRSVYAERLSEATALAESVTLTYAQGAAEAAAALKTLPRITPIASLRKPRGVILPSTLRAPMRGSLSEQLAAATRSADQVSDTFRQRSMPSNDVVAAAVTGTDALLLVLTGISFRVGRISSHQCAPVTFSHGAARYCFRGGGRNVDMIMRFNDIKQTCTVRGCELFFKVVNEMPAFSTDYTPTNPSHIVSITFPTTSAAQCAFNFINKN